MIILNTTSDVLRVVTSSANALDANASFVDVSTTTVSGSRQNTPIVSATTTNFVSAPAASTQRNVKRFTLCAKGGANTVIPQLFDGTTAFQLLGGTAITLAAGDTLEYEDGQGWAVLDPTGAIKQVLGPTINGHVIKDNGTARLQRANLNTVNSPTMVFSATDDVGNDETELGVRPQGRGTDNAGGATITMGDGDSFLLITSTTAITAFVFSADFTGRKATIVFNTARTLTHNGTSLILPTAANITTVAGDCAVVESLGSGNFRVINYQRASGGSLLQASDTAAGGIEIAIQSEQETGTDVVRAVTPGRQHFHLSAAKCWGFTTGAGTPALNAVSYNVTSIADTGVGILTVTIATDFSSASWVALCAATQSAATTCMMVNSRTKAAGTVILDCDDNAGTAADPGVGYNWAFYGDL